MLLPFFVANQIDGFSPSGRSAVLRKILLKVIASRQSLIHSHTIGVLHITKAVGSIKIDAEILVGFGTQQGYFLIYLMDSLIDFALCRRLLDNRIVVCKF